MSFRPLPKRIFPHDMGMIFVNSRCFAVVVIILTVINGNECARNRTRGHASHALHHIRNRPPSVVMVDKDKEFLNKGKSKCVVIVDNGEKVYENNDIDDVIKVVDDGIDNVKVL